MIILLAPGGKLCYIGDRIHAIEYFAALGYKCPNETNVRWVAYSFLMICYVICRLLFDYHVVYQFIDSATFIVSSSVPPQLYI
jgi:hypothetical protein